MFACTRGDIAEVQKAEGKRCLPVGIDRTSNFAIAQLAATADRKTAWEFLQHMLEAVDAERPHTLRIHLQNLDI
jgi:hypothetical protein